MIGGRPAQEQADGLLDLQAVDQAGHRGQDLPPLFHLRSFISVDAPESLRVRWQDADFPLEGDERLALFPPIGGG